MVDIHKPVILALLESRMSDYKGISKTLGFSHKIQYPANGSSGGIVIMWKDDNISIVYIFIFS